MPPEPVRILLVDDEPLVRQGLREYLATCEGTAVVGEAGDGFAAVQQLEELRPDLLFLDVQMPGMNGFEVLAQFEPEQRPVVVFVTAFEQYALRAFEAHAVDYLLKPFDEERFRGALDRARTWLAKSQAQRAAVMAGLLDEVGRRRRSDRFVVKHAGRLRLVPASEVEWIEARGNYVHLHHREGPFLLRETLTALQETLDPNHFVRVHRSTIVALPAVDEMLRLPSGDYELRLRSKVRVVMSRSYRTEFEKAIGRRF